MFFPVERFKIWLALDCDMKFCALGRRGDSHFDVVISLAIFIVFMGWFFAFVQPQFSKSISPRTALAGLDAAISSAYWEVEYSVLFLESEDKGIFPVAAELPFNWSEDHVEFLPERDFKILDGMLFFTASGNESKFIVAHSGLNITGRMSSQCRIYSDENSFTSSGVRAEFGPKGLNSLEYKNNTVMGNLYFFLNDEEVIPENHTSEYSGFAVFKGFKAGDNSILYAGFCNSSRVFTMVRSNSEKQVRLRFFLKNMTHYYVDNERYGPIDEIPAGGFGNFSRLFFYDNETGRGIAIAFNTNVSLNRSEGGENVLDFSVLAKSVYFWISPFDNAENLSFSGYRSWFGVIRKVRALNPYFFSGRNKFSHLINRTGYLINITCPSFNYSEGTVGNEIANIYARTFVEYAVYDNGRVERCIVHEEVSQ